MVPRVEHIHEVQQRDGMMLPMQDTWLWSHRKSVFVLVSGQGKSSSYISESRKMCHLRAPIWKKDHVSIIPIPRGDEFPFSHLVMDCIGPRFLKGDAVATHPKFNYVLVVVDLFWWWPMAYPLSSMNSKTYVNACCKSLWLSQYHGNKFRLWNEL